MKDFKIIIDLYKNLKQEKAWFILLIDWSCALDNFIIREAMKNKKVLTEEEKRKRGLIKTPAKALNSHFNYYYISDPS